MKNLSVQKQERSQGNEKYDVVCIEVIMMKNTRQKNKGGFVSLVLCLIVSLSGTVWAGGTKTVVIVGITHDPFVISAVNFGVPTKWVDHPKEG